MPVSGKGQGQGESRECSGLLLPHHQDPQLGKWGSNETPAMERQPERPSLLPVPFLSPSCQPPASALALCARVHAEPYRHMPRSSRGTWILPTLATHQSPGSQGGPWGLSLDSSLCFLVSSFSLCPLHTILTPSVSQVYLFGLECSLEPLGME